MKPKRTLGISLAILASVMLFSILPFLQIAMILILDYRLQQVQLPTQDGTVAPVAVGGDFANVANLSLVIQGILGCAFLVIAFCAWRGRPAWIRYALLVGVLVLTVVTMIFSITPLLTNPDLSGGIDSGEAIRRTLLSGRMVLSVLVALYVVWYMNRGPARAYYRGYYLSDPPETTSSRANRR